MHNEDTGSCAGAGPHDRWAGHDLQRFDTGAPQEWSRTPPHGTPPAPAMVIEGRYELLEPIGSGGMGEVWKARDRRLRRLVAVKGLLDRNAMTAGTQTAAMQRARREAEAIAKIEHQNVVTVHDQVETDNQVWIVMKLLEARSLADLLRSERVLSVPRAADIGLQILQGLRAVHEASVVHRDVKPGNVLVRDDGLAILVDFGIATFDGADRVTRSGSVVGTPSYLAPELFAPASPGPAPASDLWALGVTLYEMAEGRVPFGGGEVWEVQENIRRSPEPALRYAGPLSPVIQGLLIPDPRQRLDAATAEAMLREAVKDPITPRDTPATSPAPAAPAASSASAAASPASVPAADSGPAAPSPPAPSPPPPSPAHPPLSSAPPSEAAARPSAAVRAPSASAPAPRLAVPPSSPTPTPAPAEPGPAPGPVAQRPGGRRGRPPGWKAAAAVVCAALLAGAVWFAAQGDGSGGGAGGGSGDQAGADRGQGEGPAGDRTKEFWRDTHPTLEIGVKDDQPGLSKYDEKTRTYQGYDIDLAYAIADSMGYERGEVAFTTVATDYRSTALKTKQVDLVIASYSITDDRKSASPGEYSVDFAGPYYEASRGFLVRETSKKYTINDSSDLQKLGVEVCTARDSTYETELPKQDFVMARSQPNTYQDCLDKLLDPKSDVYAVASDDIILAGYVKANPGKVRRLENIKGAEGYGVAMRPKSPVLKGEVCAALRTILDSKTWEDMYKDNLSGLVGDKNPPGRPELTECEGH
ncbi:serine/threonine-protein kinase [Streptomyces pratensis]|uniref:serine/threonine-protein kinase n=1 Tax=Streptomyces pratensis TaxID=1169025 RepID=UPI0030178125